MMAVDVRRPARGTRQAANLTSMTCTSIAISITEDKWGMNSQVVINMRPPEDHVEGVRYMHTSDVIHQQCPTKAHHHVLAWLA